MKNVMAKLEGKEGYGNEEQGADGFDYIVEVDGLPPLGTRVTRGPDWHWGNQDTEGPGTIINHYDKHGGGKRNDHFYCLKRLVSFLFHIFKVLGYCDLVCRMVLSFNMAYIKSILFCDR